MLLDPAGFFVDAHAKHGPVFRTRLARLDYTVLAGEQARAFFSEHRERFFSREAFYRRFARELGSEFFVLSAPADGGEHAQLRKAMRVGFSREIAAPFVPDMLEAARAEARGWREGQSVPVMETLARLTFQQYGWAMADRDLSAVFGDARLFAQSIMDVGAWVWPAAILMRPAYQRAKRRVFALMRELLGEARRRAQEDAALARVTVLDVLLRATDRLGAPIAEDVLVSSALYGFVGTIVYMNRAIAFLLYELARHPSAMERATAEADAAFAEGPVTADVLRRMSFCRAALAESLRLHPIAIGLPFQVEEDFEFAGCRVERGQFVLISPVPNHFSPAYYRDPWSFEPERCLAHRNEHRSNGAYSPFGFGTRVCSAVGLVETISLATVAALLSEVRLELTRPSYRLRTMLDPLPGPEASFRLKVAARRRPEARPPLAPIEEQLAVPELSGSEVGRLLGKLEVASYAPGAVIVREGDPAAQMFVLVEGEVEVTRQGPGGQATVLARLGPGRYFGEVGLLISGRRTATVRCLERPVRAIALDRAAFERMVAEVDLPSSEIAIHARRRFMALRLAEALPRLPRARVEQFLSELELVEHPAGALVVQEGDPSESFHVVARGEVEVVQQTPHGPVVRARLVAGESFGEVGLLLKRPRTASVRAGREGAEVMRMSRSAFLAMTSSSGEGGAEAVLAELLQRVERIVSQDRARSGEPA
jgi:cytochrome P450/CRP-like cAMP-binding protein